MYWSVMSLKRRKNVEQVVFVSVLIKATQGRLCGVAVVVVVLSYASGVDAADLTWQSQ